MDANKNSEKIRERFSEIPLIKAVFITFFSMMLALAGIMIIYSTELRELHKELIVIITIYGILFFLYLWTIRKKDLSITAILKGSGGNLGQIIHVLPLLAFSVGLIWMTLVLISLFNTEMAQGYFDFLNSVEFLVTGPETTFIEYAMILLAVSVMAPVMEEIVFRGILVERLGSKYGYKTAVLVSSVFFGILHIDFVGTFFAGVFLCLVYLKTKSLLLPILIHMANNTLASFMYFFQNDYISSFESLEAYVAHAWAGAALFLIGAAWLTWYLRKNWHLVHDSKSFPLQTKQEVVEAVE